MFLQNLLSEKVFILGSMFFVAASQLPSTPLMPTARLRERVSVGLRLHSTSVQKTFSGLLLVKLNKNVRCQL
jgi:hypothetical protein